MNITFSLIINSFFDIFRNSLWVLTPPLLEAKFGGRRQKDSGHSPGWLFGKLVSSGAGLSMLSVSVQHTVASHLTEMVSHEASLIFDLSVSDSCLLAASLG